MIVRAILKNPDLADNFDYFNDFRDTLGWLHMERGINPSPECDMAISRLEQGHANYLEKFQNENKVHYHHSVANQRSSLQ